MRPLLLAVVASLSLLLSGCCHWGKCPCTGGPQGSGQSGGVQGPLHFSEQFCAASADVQWVAGCLAKAENDTQQGACCHRFSQVPGTAGEQDALRACVAYCASP
jgi:hypothetical protein